MNIKTKILEECQLKQNVNVFLIVLAKYDYVLFYELNRHLVFINQKLPQIKGISNVFRNRIVHIR